MVFPTTINKNLQTPNHGTAVDYWDQPLNYDFTSLDAALGKLIIFNATAGSKTLSDDPANAYSYIPLIIEIQGELNGTIGNVVYTIPSGVGGVWIVRNYTTDLAGTGPWAVSFVNAATGLGVAIPRGYSSIINSDGSSVLFSDSRTPTAAGSNRQIQFNSGGYLGASTNLVYTSAGRLGVGTSSPAGELHVQQSIDGEIFRVQRSGGTNIPILLIDLNETNNVATITETGAVAGSIAFNTGSTERMRITAGGNVGIGGALVAGDSKLYVNGDISMPLEVGIGSNLYYDESISGLRYIGNGYGAWMSLCNSGTGAFNFFRVASGTADSPASLINTMTIDNASNLSVVGNISGGNISGGNISCGNISGGDISGGNFSASGGLTAAGQIQSGSSTRAVLRNDAGAARADLNLYANDVCYVTFGKTTGAFDIGRVAYDTSINHMGFYASSVEVAGISGGSDRSLYVYSSGGFSGSFSGDTGLVKANGYQCKYGTDNGTCTPHAFNILFDEDTNLPYLFIDTTNLGAIATYSDYRVKKNIETQATSGVDRVKKLRPVSYQIADYGTLFKASGITREGFIAHELAEVIPSAVDGARDEEGKLQSLRLDALVSVLTKAIQEQQVMIEDLQAHVAKLEAK